MKENFVSMQNEAVKRSGYECIAFIMLLAIAVFLIAVSTLALISDSFAVMLVAFASMIFS